MNGQRLAEAGRVVPGRVVLVEWMSSAARLLLVTTLVVCATPWLAHSAAAQTSAASGADQRQAAAEAYDRGTAAYLRGDYARAAGWFETANRLAPAAPALIQAVRAYTKATQLPRALTLALRLESTYSDDERATRVASDLLEAHAAEFVRVEVQCEACQIDLDGKLQEAPQFFIEPGREYQVTAIFATGDLEKTIAGEAAETLTVAFEAPEAPDLAATVERSETHTAGRSDSSLFQPSSGRTLEDEGLNPLAVYIGAGVTAVLGGITIVSGISARNRGDSFDRAVSDFRAAGCEGDAPDLDACIPLEAKVTTRYDTASAAEDRTNVLLAVTVAAGVATGVMALFVDWNGERETARERPLQLGLSTLGDGAYATLGGAF